MGLPLWCGKFFWCTRPLVRSEVGSGSRTNVYFCHTDMNVTSFLDIIATALLTSYGSQARHWHHAWSWFNQKTIQKERNMALSSTLQVKKIKHHHIYLIFMTKQVYNKKYMSPPPEDDLLFMCWVTVVGPLCKPELVELATCTKWAKELLLYTGHTKSQVWEIEVGDVSPIFCIQTFIEKSEVTTWIHSIAKWHHHF